MSKERSPLLSLVPVALDVVKATYGGVEETFKLEHRALDNLQLAIDALGVALRGSSRRMFTTDLAQAQKFCYAHHNQLRDKIYFRHFRAVVQAVKRVKKYNTQHLLKLLGDIKSTTVSSALICYASVRLLYLVNLCNRIMSQSVLCFRECLRSISRSFMVPVCTCMTALSASALNDAAVILRSVLNLYRQLTALPVSAGSGRWRKLYLKLPRLVNGVVDAEPATLFALVDTLTH